MSAVLSRKEREKKARQHEILLAARQLFSSQGYHATTLEDIAHHAEFGKGTIYNYFSSKEELFCAIVDQLTEEVLELARTTLAIPAHSAREKLTSYAHAIVTHARENVNLFYLIGRELHQLTPEQRKIRVQQLRGNFHKLWKLIAKPLHQDMLEGKIRAMDPYVVAALFDNMLRSYCINHYGLFRSQQEDGADHAVSLIITIFFDGIIVRN
jgi:AcrR family transcriptional regulator